MKKEGKGPTDGFVLDVSGGISVLHGHGCAGSVVLRLLAVMAVILAAGMCRSPAYAQSETEPYAAMMHIAGVSDPEDLDESLVEEMYSFMHHRYASIRRHAADFWTAAFSPSTRSLRYWTTGAGPGTYSPLRSLLRWTVSAGSMPLRFRISFRLTRMPFRGDHRMLQGMYPILLLCGMGHGKRSGRNMSTVMHSSMDWK